MTVTGLGAVAALAGGSQGLALWATAQSCPGVATPTDNWATVIATERCRCPFLGSAVSRRSRPRDWHGPAEQRHRHRLGRRRRWPAGNGTDAEAVTTPVQVSGFSEVTAIAAGGGYSLALLRNGTVMAWGEAAARTTAMCRSR